jgi:hypothetical protein
MKVNFNACITQWDIIASNGIVHIIDGVVLPPLSMMQVVSLLSPEDFSMMQPALERQDLEMNLPMVRLEAARCLSRATLLFATSGQRPTHICLATKERNVFELWLNITSFPTKHFTQMRVQANPMLFCL